MTIPATIIARALDTQLDILQDDATILGLCKNFLRSDNYATTAGKVIASLAITSGHAFWGTRVDETSAPGDANAPNRKQNCTSVELAPATGTANGTSDDLSLVLLSATEVLAATDETTDRAVATSDVITTFVTYFTASQPAGV
jgi:hypothetical protein